jgi:hypothetical protein
VPAPLGADPLLLPSGSCLAAVTGFCEGAFFGRESGARVEAHSFGGYALLPAQPFQYDADLLFS